MGLKIGNTDFNGGYVGSNAISAIYMGSDKVWPTTVTTPDSPILPPALADSMYVSYASVAGGHMVGNPMIFDMPPSASEGDLAVIMMATDNSTSNRYIQVPTGWTRNLNDAASNLDTEIMILSKFLTTTDISASTVTVTSTYTSPFFDGGGYLMVFPDYASGLNNPPSNLKYATTRVFENISPFSSTSSLTPNITTQAGGKVVFGFACFDGVSGNGAPITTDTPGWSMIHSDVVSDGVQTGTLAVGLAIQDALSTASYSNPGVNFIFNGDDQSRVFIAYAGN